jgi:hypothetical protein
LGGWTEGLLAENYRVIGFDIERHQYGQHRYPAQLVLQDVLTLHGSQFKDATLIVASPPCQAYSYRAMPWSRAKALPPPDNTLFEACFRIQREACEAAGRHIPLVVENVRGAQKWVGRARWNYGSFYLWGDVPALMPLTSARKVGARYLHLGGGNSFQRAPSDMAEKRSAVRYDPRHVERRAAEAENPYKLPGFHFDGSGRSFQSASVEGTGIKGIPHRTTGHWTNPAEHRDETGIKMPSEGTYGAREKGFSHAWANRPPSRSPARKAASAMIAKIPLPLSRHIAAVYHP